MIKVGLTMYSDFARFGSCDIADGLVYSGIDDGGALPYLRQQSGPQATKVGPAYTVEYAPKSDPRPAVQEHYIDSAPSGSIIVIATAEQCQLQVAPFTTLSCSLYGGLMSTRAQHLNCAATVVCGQIRDVAEHCDLEYPVWSYGVGICAPNKQAKVVAINKPLKIGGKYVNPGDVVVADENGVASFSPSLVPKLLDYIPKRVDADNKAAADIKQGEKATVAQKRHRSKI